MPGRRVEADRGPRLSASAASRMAAAVWAVICPGPATTTSEAVLVTVEAPSTTVVLAEGEACGRVAAAAPGMIPAGAVSARVADDVAAEASRETRSEPGGPAWKKAPRPC